jgi:hypothetical protein
MKSAGRSKNSGRGGVFLCAFAFHSGGSGETADQAFRALAISPTFNGTSSRQPLPDKPKLCFFNPQTTLRSLAGFTP